MKTMNQFKTMAVVATTALMTLASCSKEPNEPMTTDSTKANLSVSVTAPESRAIVGGDEVTAGKDNKINNFTAFVAYADGTLVSRYSSDGSDLTGDKAITVAKSQADGQHVYVVANAGDLTSYKTMTALNAYPTDLGVTNAGKQEPTKIWASGQTASGLSFTQNGDVFEATANVTLVFIPARITLTIENGMQNYDAGATDNNDLVLKSVALLNARGATKLFGASLVATPSNAKRTFYQGLANNSFAYYPATANCTEFFAQFSDAIPANDFSKKYYYYAFENNATTASTFPTIVTITAKFDGKDVYYPVHLAQYEQFFSGSIGSEGLKRGKSYDITIRLTVDPKKDGTGPGGTVDPTDPDVSAKVQVMLTINDWIPVTLVKEF